VTTFTLVHVALSLVGIGSGFVMMFGLLSGKRLDGWTSLFLVSTAATSVTGFLFPFHRLMPSHIIGLISLLVLTVAIFARYTRHLTGRWRRTYVVSAIVALYLNVFVAIFQAFLKVPALKAMAPTQSEPPFAITQAVVLVFFIVLSVVATKRFRDELSLGTQAIASNVSSN
jgi:hypothetical protein